ncbi:hypothetical protein QX776_09650 [Alteromonadaceae bacterium BrNp21-10]|nr:hypothetical protein [Alteromonadaceae bacterium BrNp21-10]
MITQEEMNSDNLVGMLKLMSRGINENREELSSISAYEKDEIKRALDEFSFAIRFLLPPGKACKYCNGSGVETKT